MRASFFDDFESFLAVSRPTMQRVKSCHESTRNDGGHAACLATLLMMSCADERDASPRTYYRSEISPT